MVQMYFETVIQAEPRITLDEFVKHAPDHISFKLVMSPETNAHHIILTFSMFRILITPNFYHAYHQLNN